MSNKPRKYAEDTKVPVSQSKSEIEELLNKHGATGTITGSDQLQGYEFIQFRFGECAMARLIMPTPTEDEMMETDSGYTRGTDRLNAAIQKERRRRWRVLLITVKAKLEFIDTGLTTFEKEFLGDLLLPDGATVSQKMAPQLETMYKSGKMPNLLGPGK